jgi:uncharacterized membrane protein
MQLVLLHRGASVLENMLYVNVMGLGIVAVAAWHIDGREVRAGEHVALWSDWLHGPSWLSSIVF